MGKRALKRCPFCGARAFVSRYDYDRIEDGHEWFVHCRGSIGLDGTCLMDGVYCSAATRQAAIDKWNTRAGVSDATN